MHGKRRLKLQSAIEFLTTYSFALLVLAGAVFVVFTITATTRTDTRSQCVSSGSINCNFVSFYSGSGASYSVFSVSITNSQAAQINVTGMKVSVDSVSYSGICSPNLLMPGQQATCTAGISAGSRRNVPKNGFFSISTRLCNMPYSAYNASCNENVSYGGTFYTYSTPYPTTIFSAIASVGNSSTQLPTYTGNPDLPDGYGIANSYEWVGVQGSGTVAYALGTPGFSPGTYFGIKAGAFPSELYYLNYNSVSCSSGYNSTLSLAYTAIYLNSSASVSFSAYADNAIAAWYKPEGSNTWDSLFGNSYWPSASVGNEASNTVSLSKGLYSVAVEWANTCGAGLQAFQISGSGI